MVESKRALSDKSASSKNSELEQECVRKYFSALEEKQSMAYAVIQALNHAILQSKETTIQALHEEFNTCADHLLTSIQNHPDFVDRTLLSMRALVRIYFRMASKVDYERKIEEIRTDIFLKGTSFADHSL